MDYQHTHKKKNTISVYVPVSHPAENLRGSSLLKACLDDGCGESPGSQHKCPVPQTELSGPHVEQALPLCDSTAADAPKQFEWFKSRTSF